MEILRIPIEIDICSLTYVDPVNDVNSKFGSLRELVDFIEEMSCRQGHQPGLHGRVIVKCRGEKLWESEDYWLTPLSDILDVILTPRCERVQGGYARVWPDGRVSALCSDPSCRECQAVDSHIDSY